MGKILLGQESGICGIAYYAEYGHVTEITIFVTKLTNENLHRYVSYEEEKI